MVKLKHIRKFFGVPSKKERLLLEEGKLKFKAIATEAANKENEDNKRRAEHYNSSCSSCGGKTIVDKIVRLQGGGSWRHFDIDTNEVSHCNNCGHQWKKHKYNYITFKDEVERCLWSIRKGEEAYSFKPTLLKLKDIPAESIYELHAEEKQIWDTFASISMLRKYFPSIYN
jgi:predicted nucleic-acid-binding Zn-ribbon protein